MNVIYRRYIDTKPFNEKLLTDIYDPIPAPKATPCPYKLEPSTLINFQQKPLYLFSLISHKERKQGQRILVDNGCRSRRATPKVPDNARGTKYLNYQL